MGKQFDKTVVVREQFKNWKDGQVKLNAGFFPIYNDFTEILRDLSGGACLLYVYFGLHSKNKTGESFHDIGKIAAYFNKTTRTISQWAAELERKRLIYRTQVKYNGVTYTYLLPYGSNSEPFATSIDEKFKQIEQDSTDDD